MGTFKGKESTPFWKDTYQLHKASASGEEKEATWEGQACRGY